MIQVKLKKNRIVDNTENKDNTAAINDMLKINFIH